MDRVCHQLQAVQLDDDQAQEEQGAAVLRLLLQHDSARRELRVVSRLLCCSKELAAAVAEHCAGQLVLDHTTVGPVMRPSSQQPGVLWLRKHARLAKSLNLLAFNNWVEPLMAAGPHNLRLQALAARTDPTLPLLEQLPARFLTRLVLTVAGAPASDQGGAPLAARVSAALGRLTALHSLDLFNDCDIQLPGLSALSNLTRLHYQGRLFAPQHVPGQLLQLRLRFESQDFRGPGVPSMLDLRHLTALTSLEWMGLMGTAVAEGDLLPPSLLRLEAACKSVQPLLPLQQLQYLHLELQGTDITTAQLLEMSNLTSLDITYTSAACGGLPVPSTMAIAPAGAAAWLLLPLKQLRLLDGVRLAPAICQALAQATGLTSLCLRACVVPGGPQQLAAVLSSLSGLQDLQLDRPFTAEQSEGMSQLVQAVGSLTRLRRLHVAGVAQFAALGLHSSMRVPLSAVTELHLIDCDLCDGLVSVFPCLPELRSLSLSLNARLTDAGLCAILPQVQQLTSLAIDETGVTDAGLHLTSLTRLRKVFMGDVAGVSLVGVQRLRGLLPGAQIAVDIGSASSDAASHLAKPASPPQQPAAQVTYTLCA